MTSYGIIEPKARLPEIGLFKVPHKGRDLIVGYPPFGRNPYLGNIGKMRQHFYHSDESPRVSFRPATTAESISATAFDFPNLAKPKILDKTVLHLGLIVRTSEGIFANPPRDSQENPITDESVLKSCLDQCEKVEGIYVSTRNDFGFAPYESFTRGVQDNGDLAEGGLAKLLEHSEDATNLRQISSKDNYPDGVNVIGYNETKKPVLTVSMLDSWGIAHRRLELISCHVDDYW